ncbi:actinodin1 [Esox lucius]|uniref:Actinodin1 n=1 Tax=Esox lucius TaxID=8010 RepID=A0A3P9A0G1_ESOLU|nr:actinodin1 [Esox lucius]XP_019897226.2 actinodin1 [Esox lucius]XP_019897228.2 actinodin1 [Esox lucius]
MAGGRRTSFSGVFTVALLAAVLLPEFLSAGPVIQELKDAVDATEETAVAAASTRRLVRNRRNISWYKQHSDFWSWYKFFTDNGNQEAVQELDKVYLAYLQNKNRAEGRRSYKAYLSHLGDVYKACADSEDPDCVSSATSRPKPTPPPKPAPVKACDPYRDPSCLYAAMANAKGHYAPVLPQAPAPVKAPAPLYVKAPAAVSDPNSGYYYYSPAVQSFLSQEQKAELLRICSAEDVECLQYHLRAAFGYKPSAGPVPSYAHLGCDPKTDPGCKPQLVQKTPAGLFLRYPNCDPRDPRCAYTAFQQAPRAPPPPPPAGPGSCNPLFEDGCNPLTATKFATAPEKYKEEHKDEAASMRAAPQAPEQRSDPFTMYRDAYANANSANDPYAMYRQTSDPRAQANDPYAMYRQASDPSGQANDPYANYRQASASSDPASDPYTMYRQAIANAQASDPYAMYRQANANANTNDPFAMYREAASAMNRRAPPSTRQQAPAPPPRYEEPPQEDRHPLGPRGKTKEGYDCFIGYDQECYPLSQAEPRSGHHRNTAHPAEPYEPHLNADGTRRGVLEPSNPDCDPEYDADCRLRRHEPQGHLQPDANDQEEQHRAEPERDGEVESEPYQSGQEESYGAYAAPSHGLSYGSYPPRQRGMPSFQDMLRGYADQYPEQDDHRAHSADYRKK